MRTLEVRNELNQLIGYHEVVSLDIDNINIQADVNVSWQTVMNTNEQKLLVARETERIASRIARNLPRLQSLIASTVKPTPLLGGVAIISDGVIIDDGMYQVDIPFIIKVKPGYRLTSANGVMIIERLCEIRRIAVSHGVGV